jgi:hypothetical protein
MIYKVTLPDATIEFVQPLINSVNPAWKDLSEVMTEQTG